MMGVRTWGAEWVLGWQGWKSVSGRSGESLGESVVKYYGQQWDGWIWRGSYGQRQAPGGGSDRKGGSHTWVAVQGLGVLTAAPGEASRADAHVAAAL